MALTQFLSQKEHDPAYRDFLSERFKFFLIINCRKATIGNIREIVEFAAVLTEVDSLQPITTFKRYVKPRIIKTINADNKHQGHPGIEQHHQNFSQVLRSLFDTINVSEALLIVRNDRIMADISSQCEIELAFKETFPSDYEMSFFDTYCDLSDFLCLMMGQQRRIKAVVGGEDLWKKYWSLYPLEKKQGILESTLGLLELVRFFQGIFRPELLVTTYVNRPPNNYSLTAEKRIRLRFEPEEAEEPEEPVIDDDSAVGSDSDDPNAYARAVGDID